MPASQSALLLGPELSLRWGSHAMSSCDGVRPIVVRAGAVHPEGDLHPTRRLLQTSKLIATSPRTGGHPTQEPSNLESSAKFPSGRGHHIPAPSWEGCRATFRTLLSWLSVPAGGCRSSGWEVGIKEGVPASQSALLLGPEHSLRWGSHSMSSCDGVRPIVI